MREAAGTPCARISLGGFVVIKDDLIRSSAKPIAFVCGLRRAAGNM